MLANRLHSITLPKVEGLSVTYYYELFTHNPKRCTASKTMLPPTPQFRNQQEIWADWVNCALTASVATRTTSTVNYNTAQQVTLQHVLVAHYGVIYHCQCLLATCSCSTIVPLWTEWLQQRPQLNPLFPYITAGQ